MLPPHAIRAACASYALIFEASMKPESPESRVDIDELTPRQIVAELDRYIVGQQAAKRAVALAVRNRVRRRRVEGEIQDEIYPKNIIMIGPTGCGKTEIARRLSRLSGAPFVKVEATKYTEVGYVGRDVESMIRDLVSASVNVVRKEFRSTVQEQAERNVRERLLDLLLPSSRSGNAGAGPSAGGPQQGPQDFFRSLAQNMQNLQGMSPTGQNVQAGLGAANQSGAKAGAEDSSASEESEEAREKKERARELFARKLDAGELEEREIEIETSASSGPNVQVLGAQPGMEDLDMQLQNMLGDFLPKKNKRRRLPVSEARKVLLEEELDRLVDPDKVQTEAIRRAEQMGVVFIDEIDKIAGRGGSGSGGGGCSGPDVSREGVQRDLLPIVEGATVQTRQGPVKTDHMLFIAAGAFTQSKPSDLIPELQGRFPIRVELEKLTEADFRLILTGPRNSLVRQSVALLETEGVTLDFQDAGLDEIARFAFEVNENTENIGARRLHTILERLLEDVSFEAPDLPEPERRIVIDRAYVQERLHKVVEDQDLSRYIL